MRPAIFIIPVLTAIMAMPALAETAAARPTDSVYACAGIADDTARLACFDQAVSALKLAEDAGTVQTVDIEEIQKIENESFGFSLPSLAEVFRNRGDSDKSQSKARKTEEITAGIKSIRVNSVTRKVTVTLENGQVWEQIDTQTLPRSKIRKGKVAKIKLALMDSFLMTIDGSGTSIRVRRIG